MHINNSINCSLRTSRLYTPPHRCTSEFGQEKQAYGHTRNVAWQQPGQLHNQVQHYECKDTVDWEPCCRGQRSVVSLQFFCLWNSMCNFDKLSLPPVITTPFSAGVTVAWKQQTANTSTNITRSIQSIKYTTESTWRNKKTEKGESVRGENEASGLNRLEALARLIDFVASRYTWICTIGYMGTLIYSLIQCQHPAVTQRCLGRAY